MRVVCRRGELCSRQLGFAANRCLVIDLVVRGAGGWGRGQPVMVAEKGDPGRGTGTSVGGAAVVTEDLLGLHVGQRVFDAGANATVCC